MKCKICNAEIKSFPSLIAHLRWHHKDWNSKLYYDTFYKTGQDGQCTCGKPTKYTNISLGYKTYCSTKCSNSSSDVQDKKLETITRNFGGYGSPDILKRRRKTCMEKYGEDNYMKTPEFREKYRKTMMEKYGAEHNMHVPELAEKCFASKSWKNRKYVTCYGDHITYQSKLELEFIKLCEKSNIRILNGDRIWYEFDERKRAYHCDFKIYQNGKWRLVEIKASHGWYLSDERSGKLKAKTEAAKKYSNKNGYLSFIMLLDEVKIP